MSTSEAVRPFGWQGIEIAVPAPWELSGYHGNHERGYACLDDGIQVRLQVRWERATGGLGNLDTTLRRYKRSLEKAGRGRVSLEMQSPDLLPERFRDAKDLMPFHWVADREGYGAAWHCQACRRVLLVEVLFPRGEGDPRLARRVLASTRDHREDGQRLWSVYGFAFRTPDTYNLERPSLAPGRLQFLLRASRRIWLRVERWAVASQWAEQAPLAQWPDELLRGFRLAPRGSLEQSEAEIHGHSGRRFTAVAGRRGLLGRQRVEGMVWRCPEEDKLFAVLAGGGRENLSAQVAATIACA